MELHPRTPAFPHQNEVSSTHKGGLMDSFTVSGRWDDFATATSYLLLSMSDWSKER